MKDFKPKTLFIVFFTLIILNVSVSGCLKKIGPINQNLNQNQNINSNVNSATTTEVTENDSVFLTKDKDGWKTYTNKDWGIRFGFEDKNDLYQLKWSTKNDVAFIKLGDKPGNDEYLYIIINNYDSNNEYSSLMAYIKGVQLLEFQTETKLISVKSLKYQNLKEVYMTQTEGNKYLKVEESEVNPKIFSEHIYINHPYKHKTYISIPNIIQPTVNQILSAFEFLEK